MLRPREFVDSLDDQSESKTQWTVYVEILYYNKTAGVICMFSPCLHGFSAGAPASLCRLFGIGVIKYIFKTYFLERFSPLIKS